MTAKQKQLILCCFDLLLPDAVDGIWGPQSEAATRKLQQELGISEDGIFGSGTRDAAFRRLTEGRPPEGERETTDAGDFWKDISFFSREEFRCQCGGKYCGGFPVEPQPAMVRTVDEIRRRLGVPVTVVEAGGLRCPLSAAQCRCGRGGKQSASDGQCRGSAFGKAP